MGCLSCPSVVDDCSDFQIVAISVKPTVNIDKEFLVFSLIFLNCRSAMMLMSLVRSVMMSPMRFVKMFKPL